MKKALIIGSSGLVGGYCLQLLLEDDRYVSVTALTRKKLDVSHPKLNNPLVDFDNKETWEAYCAVDDVFSVMGTTIAKAGSQENFKKVDYLYPLQIATEARNQGAAQHVLVSAVGADRHSVFFYNRVKGDIEEQISRIGFSTNVILRPSMLLGERKESRPAEKFGQQIFRRLSFLFKGPSG